MCNKMAFESDKVIRDYIASYFHKETRKMLNSKRSYKCQECGMLHLTSMTKVKARSLNRKWIERKRKKETYLDCQLRYFLNKD